MLNKAKTLKGYKLDSLDGEIGKVREFFFDDRYWAIRYLVADTGNWLTGRQVLISPYALVSANRSEKHITVSLSKKQIEDSPALDTDKPVSQQFEENYNGYYGWPGYRNGPHMWGASSEILRDRKNLKESGKDEKSWDTDLRSTRAVSEYYIQATDGEIGHVDDFIIDDKTWAIRYLIIDTTNWWPGKKVLVSTRWIDHVSWNDSKVFISLTRDAIKQSPEYTDESLLTRDYETGLHEHYGQQGYWAGELAAMGRS